MKPKLTEKDFNILSWALDTLELELIELDNRHENNPFPKAHDQDIKDIRELSYKLSKIKGNGK